MKILLFAVSNTPRATPYMAHQKRVNINTGDSNEDVDSNHDNGDKKPSGNHPRGINRLSSKLGLIIITCALMIPEPAIFLFLLLLVDDLFIARLILIFKLSNDIEVV